MSIVTADRGGAYVVVPPAVIEALGGGGRIPVRATFDGIEYQGSVASMGGAKVLGVLTAIREELRQGSRRRRRRDAGARRRAAAS